VTRGGKRAGAGRKAFKPPAEVRSVNVTVRVTPAERERLREIETQGRSVREVLVAGMDALARHESC